MGKLFGTDGIRGVVGENLTADLAFRTGKAIAAVLKEEKGRKPVITIGKDTRISSDMLESALIAGICSVGGDVMPFGVLPTPAVAYLTVLKGADAGIVISASHNPYEHNGIKVFNEKGYKLPDAIEEQVEEKILTDIYPAATHGEIGVLRHGLRQSREAYIDHLAGTIEGDLSGLRVLVDCSNGASSATAPELFGRFRCFCDFIHREPDGVNINDHCGSTHLDDLAQKVVAGGYDIGVAFDGDADRCLCGDETGMEITGDHILFICGRHMKQTGELLGNIYPSVVLVCVIYLPLLWLAAREIGHKRYITRTARMNIGLTGAALFAVGLLALWPAYHVSEERHVLRDEIFPLNIMYNLGLSGSEFRKSYNFHKTSEGFTYEAERTAEAPGREVYVYIIGEASRAMNWQLYGYGRETNPLLSEVGDLVVFRDVLTQSNTTHKSVPLILSSVATGEHEELYRRKGLPALFNDCLLYTSDAADD